MTKDRIIFFADGDFAIDTFETLVNFGVLNGSIPR